MLMAQGHTGAPAPEGGKIASGLATHQMYIYCGHGAGEQYLPAHCLRRLPSCSAALLMGCSSGRLQAAGCYDACGPVLAYLIAGIAPALRHTELHKLLALPFGSTAQC